MLPERQTTATQSHADKSRAVRIIAKSIYRELQAQGYGDREVVALATELIGEVTEKKPEPTPQTS